MFKHKFIGIEAGDNYLNLVHGAVYRKRFEVIHHKEMGLNLMDGGITDVTAFQDAIAAFKRDNNIKTNKVAIVIKTTKAIIRFESFPYMKPKELSKAVEQNAGNSFPIDIDTFAVDYRVVSKKNRNMSENINIMFVGLPNEICCSYTDALVQLKLKPLYLDIFQNSVARYFSRFDSGDFAIISEFPSRINLILVKKGDIKAVVDLTYTSEDVGRREMGKYFASKGLGCDKVYLLNDVGWIRNDLEQRRIKIILEQDLLIPLKGLFVRGEF